MKNFIFKSQGTSTYKKLINKLEIIQSELRHARTDHVMIIALLNKLVTDGNLQKQVETYYDADQGQEHPDEDDR